MVQKPTTYALDEFNHEVLEGRILEEAVTGPLQLVRISCSSFTSIGRGLCGAHLRDLWIVTFNNTRFYFVGCPACGWCSNPAKINSYRRIGREGYLDYEVEGE